MKMFQARARAEEAVYANRQTREFLATANSLRRLGEWAAQNMEKADPDAVSAYADALVRAGVVGEDVLSNVKDDLREQGGDLHQSVDSKFDAYLAEARAQIV